MLNQICLVLAALWISAIAVPTGNHTCTGVVKHPVTVEVNVTEPVTFRVYTWCFRVPPRCSKYTVQMKDRVKVHTEMHNRTITVCCKGFVEMEGVCVPGCPPQTECPNMHCNRTNHCYCSPGYAGPFCMEPCSYGFWGKDCKKPCDCPEGFTCHHLTGDCMLDDRPQRRQKKNTTIEPTTEVGKTSAETSKAELPRPTTSSISTTTPTTTTTQQTTTSTTERTTIKKIITQPSTTTPTTTTLHYTTTSLPTTTSPTPTFQTTQLPTTTTPYTTPSIPTTITPPPTTTSPTTTQAQYTTTPFPTTTTPTTTSPTTTPAHYTTTPFPTTSTTPTPTTTSPTTTQAHYTTTPFPTTTTTPTPAHFTTTLFPATTTTPAPTSPTTTPSTTTTIHYTLAPFFTTTPIPTFPTTTTTTTFATTMISPTVISSTTTSPTTPNPTTTAIPITSPSTATTITTHLPIETQPTTTSAPVSVSAILPTAYTTEIRVKPPNPVHNIYHPPLVTSTLSSIRQVVSPWDISYNKKVIDFDKEPIFNPEKESKEEEDFPILEIDKEDDERVDLGKTKAPEETPRQRNVPSTQTTPIVITSPPTTTEFSLLGHKFHHVEGLPPFLFLTPFPRTVQPSSVRPKTSPTSPSLFEDHRDIPDVIISPPGDEDSEEGWKPHSKGHIFHEEKHSFERNHNTKPTPPVWLTIPIVEHNQNPSGREVFQHENKMSFKNKFQTDARGASKTEESRPIYENPHYPQLDGSLGQIKPENPPLKVEKHHQGNFETITLPQIPDLMNITQLLQGIKNFPLHEIIRESEAKTKSSKTLLKQAGPQESEDEGPEASFGGKESVESSKAVYNLLMTNEVTENPKGPLSYRPGEDKVAGEHGPQAAGVQARLPDGSMFNYLFVLLVGVGVVVMASIIVTSLILLIRRRKSSKENKPMVEGCIMAYGKPSDITVSPLLLYNNSQYSTIFPTTDPLTQNVFFCPTFTNNYAERINRELCEFSYDCPRSRTPEPLYAEIPY